MMRSLPGLFLLVLLSSNAISQQKADMVEVNGIKLYYQVSGQGPALFLLHGWLQSNAYWDPYVEAFEKEYRVYRFDLRGHGDSGILTEDFSIQATSRDIAAFAQAENISSFHGIGLSFGSLVLLQLANDQPALINKMILRNVRL